jgi:hypothetical protein
MRPDRMRRAQLENGVLAALGLAVLVLLGCGGGDAPAEEPLLAQAESQAVAGDGRAGLVAMVLPLQGPELDLPAATTVRVRLAVQLRVQAHFVAAGSAALQLAAPVATGASSQALPLQPGPAAAQDLPVYEAVLALPAGRSTLQGRLTLRATEIGTGLPTSALARAEASGDWVVTQVVEVAP